jgi:carbon-monoxide dehydrogenase medium subunit
MKPAPFDYARPATLDEALALLAGHPDAKVIAGGQSLGPMLNLRLVRSALLVDIGGLAELRGVARQGDRWYIGAATTHAALEDGECDGRTGALLSSVARGIAYRAIRNRGTVGGSLVHADPAADWPLVLNALGATAVIRGADGVREVPVCDLMTGPFATLIGRQELLLGVHVPMTSDEARWGYFKMCRKVGEFAHASAAVLIDPPRGVSRVVIGALGSPPRVVPMPAALDTAAARSVLAVALRTARPAELQMRAASLQRALAQATA